MRYVVCPSSVIVKTPDGLSTLKIERSDGSAPSDLVIDMHEFLERFVVNDAKFGRGVKTMRSAADLLTSFKEEAPGAVVRISDSDWDLARDVLENPSQPFPTFVFRQCISLANAFLDATSAPPSSTEIVPQT